MRAAAAAAFLAVLGAASLAAPKPDGAASHDAASLKRPNSDGAVSYDAAPPNIVYILVDDAGFGSWPNPNISTPHLDALAAEGLRLPDFYAFQFCSPSRASALTGRWPWRTPNARINFLPAYVMDGTPLGYAMLPARLAASNYVSYHVGKWHLGMYASAYTPLSRGFNESDGFLCGGEDHLTQAADLSVGSCNVSGVPIRDAWRGSRTAPETIGEYTGTRFTASAVAYLEQHGAKHPGAPLFLYAALHNTHAPLQALPEYLALYPNVSFAVQRHYYAMMSTVDESVGNITRALKSLGLWNNSLVVVHTDNGAPVQVGGTNYPLRGGKGSNWEGGVRVPAVISGGLLPASRRGAVAPPGVGVAHMMDLYATFVGLAGLPAADPGGPAPVDALDMWPFWSGAAPASPRADATGVPVVLDHNTFDVEAQGVHGALIAGGFKLLVGPKGGEAQAEWYGQFSPNATAPNPSIAVYACGNDSPAGGCLFNLRADPGEHTDLAAAEPALFASMMAKFVAMDATYHPPVANPPSDEAGLCAAALASDRIARPWRSAPLPGAL